MKSFLLNGKIAGLPMQHIPQVDQNDVDRIVRREFPNADYDEVSTILAAYGTKRFHREADRVRLAALKLAGGNIDRLRHEVENACCDYRDTLLAAEYPGYAKIMFRIKKLPSETVDKATQSDRDQYEKWLNRNA